MREITPEEMINRNIASLIPFQNKVRRLLRKKASTGAKSVRLPSDPFNEDIEKDIIEWLVSCGFTCSEKDEDGDIVVTWPKEQPESKPLGEWVFDELPYEFFCPACQKHSEYATKFCPNCGEEKEVK